jgi:hypothetical protein
MLNAVARGRAEVAYRSGRHEPQLAEVLAGSAGRAPSTIRATMPDLQETYTCTVDYKLKAAL